MEGLICILWHEGVSLISLQLQHLKSMIPLGSVSLILKEKNDGLISFFVSKYKINVYFFLPFKSMIPLGSVSLISRLEVEKKSMIPVHFEDNEIENIYRNLSEA